MKNQYFETPSAAVAVNFKVGSSSLARAIIAAHHPQVENTITSPPGTGLGTAYPPGKHAENVRWQSICPKVQNPKDRPLTLLPIRDPIEKFRSACVESKITDVNAKLHDLERGFGRDPHFWPQSRLAIGHEVRLYRFPGHLESLATAAGLNWPLPDIDGGNEDAEKPSLTAQQQTRILAIYSNDADLFEGISEPGVVLTPSEDSEPVPLPPPSFMTGWQAKAALALTPYPNAESLLSAVESAISAMPDGPEKTVIQSAWANNANFARNSPTIAAFAQSLSLTKTEIDDLFRLGEGLIV